MRLFFAHRCVLPVSLTVKYLRPRCRLFHHSAGGPLQLKAWPLQTPDSFNSHSDVSKLMCLSCFCPCRPRRPDSAPLLDKVGLAQEAGPETGTTPHPTPPPLSQRPRRPTSADFSAGHTELAAVSAPSALLPLNILIYC